MFRGTVLTRLAIALFAVVGGQVPENTGALDRVAQVQVLRGQRSEQRSDERSSPSGPSFVPTRRWLEVAIVSAPPAVVVVARARFLWNCARLW